MCWVPVVQWALLNLSKCVFPLMPLNPYKLLVVCLAYTQKNSTITCLFLQNSSYFGSDVPCTSNCFLRVRSWLKNFFPLVSLVHQSRCSAPTIHHIRSSVVFFLIISTLDFQLYSLLLYSILVEDSTVVFLLIFGCVILFLITIYFIFIISAIFRYRTLDFIL